ncbi:hypothetical protein J4476_00950 [Candidatus Woesearchaeota archaeon]|nr:MAG: hypothetical protein QT09_C0001G0065 [archaeon GW2011_AR18]MBS3161246.1 hypothetical protein [Candidatus Woesearchaeota archaeon]HIH25196.1 hypothetical protein [Nanoarchaeota archaeon]
MEKRGTSALLCERVKTLLNRMDEPDLENDTDFLIPEIIGSRIRHFTIPYSGTYKAAIERMEYIGFIEGNSLTMKALNFYIKYYKICD